MTDVISDFEYALCRGQFKIPACRACDKVVWPLSEFCDSCLGNVALGNDPAGVMRGRIVEYSQSKSRIAAGGGDGGNDNGREDGEGGDGGIIFCLVEFEQGIRLIARMVWSATEPAPGDPVVLTSCGIDGADGGDACYTFDVAPASSA